MKIITWNCNMAFRKKAHCILAHKPDILIVQECEHLDKLLFDFETTKPTDALWFGKNSNKGLGIFSYGKYRLHKLKAHNEDIKMIIPIAVTGGHIDFTLFAIWAYNPTDTDGTYITQVWKAINHYESLLTGKTTILMGDFNSNVIWDYRKHKLSNHAGVVAYLEKRRIVSTYHIYHKQTQGTEAHSTFYLYRHKDKPYHLDYCFVSENLASKLNSVEIGDYEYWAKYSDHAPLIVSFDNI